MVPIFSYGPGAQEFTGIIENTDVFVKMKKLLID
jgi:alkaline phosphatase